MYENRIPPYLQLIQKLIESSKGEELQILNSHSELLDPGLLSMIIVVAKKIDDRGNQDVANFLTNLALQLGEFLGSEQQETTIRKETADIFFEWGIEQFYISRFVVAFECWQQCLIIYQAIDDRKMEENSLVNLGNAYFSLGEYERAIAFYERSLDISREIKNRKGEGASLGGLGAAYHSLTQYEQAIDFHKQSLDINREIKNRKGEASCLGNLGHVYDLLGAYEQAIDFHKQSLDINREIKNRKGEATSLGCLGNAYCSLGEYERAITFHEQSLVISQEIKYRQGEADSLGNLGNAYHSLAEYQKAIAFYEKSLAISREIKDSKGEANSLGNLGNAYHSLAEYELALQSLEQSLTICQEIKDWQGKANSLETLGSVYRSLGQFEQAINYHKQSFTIFFHIKDHSGKAACLGNLANAYFSIGKLKLAFNLYEKSLAIFQDIGNRQGEATARGNLGNVYHYQGKDEEAISYHQEHLYICQKIQDRKGEATALGNLGNAYHSLGQYEQAIDYHQKSLVIYREIKHSQGEATSLNNIGSVYPELHQPQKAIENYRDCLKITKTETTITMPPLCFKAGRNLGDIGFTQDNWNLALEGYEPAIKAVEQLRKGSTTDDRRQEIIAEAISVYANAVQCYINLKQYDKAVETADRSRSRHLADLFASKDLYPKGEMPPEVEEYYRLQQQQSNRLRFSENDGTKALGTTRKPTPNDDATIKQIENLEEQKQQAWLKIRSKDQVLAGQLQPDPLSFKDMQALIPDAETALLNFYTTSEHTHIFILRQNQPTKLYTCEGQGLETLQIWLFNNWLKPYKENQTAWQNQMGEFLHELANRLQIKNLISPYLTDIKELIIIPHLYLHQIPFAALPLNDTPIPQSETPSEQTRAPKNQKLPTKTALKSSQKQPEYLSDQFRIRIVPSCQILNFCHQRGNLKPATMGIVENATGDLLFTGYECETLATMHNVDKNSRLQYQQATISNYQNLLERVQVLHSSHHAASNLNNSLESKLLLFDGDINLGRIFTWRFKDLAEVFLSCCETNLTLTPITDDPLSIASGFLCAGARNVVSTLWAVDDLATALFCILYYQEKKNKSRSDAIREAQFKLRNLTGDELSAKYQGQLEAYFEQQQWGENKTEIVNKVRIRLDFLSREKLPFVSPYNWAGFISQGLA